MTLQLYLKNTYLFHSKALVLQKGEDEKGFFIILNQTIFYPQGGGQPSDQGIIKNNHFEADVTLVRQIDGEIRHYITLLPDEILINSSIDCFVNKEGRLMNSRYHTAGHLLGNVVELAYPKLKASKGHSFPHEAYIEFQGDEVIDSIQIQNTLNKALEKDDKIKIFEVDPTSFEKQFYKIPYSIPENKKFRAMQIGDMLPVPCGGTHLSSAGEIGSVSIGKIKIKNNIARVSYQVI